MAKEACDVVRDGRLEIIPNQFEDTWFRCLSIFGLCRIQFLFVCYVNGGAPVICDFYFSVSTDCFCCLRSEVVYFAQMA